MITDIGWRKDCASENDGRQPRMHSSIELPPINNHINHQSIPPFHSPRPRDLLPSMMARSPPGRSSTLPPLQRKESVKRDKPNRPRKSSITQNSRKPKHEKKTSKDFARRMSIEGRKAFSAEPPGAREAAVAGRRWQDLVEAATSATEADSDRDLTPVTQPSQLVFLQATHDPLDPTISSRFNQACLSTSFLISLPQSILQSLASRQRTHTPDSTSSVRSSTIPIYRDVPRFHLFQSLHSIVRTQLSYTLFWPFEFI